MQVHVRGVHTPQWARTDAWGDSTKRLPASEPRNPFEHHERALREIDIAPEGAAHDQKRECVEDARSTKEWLRGKIVALDCP